MVSVFMMLVCPKCGSLVIFRVRLPYTPT